MKFEVEVTSCIPFHSWKEINKHLNPVELRWAISNAIEQEYAKALKKVNINPDACWVSSVKKNREELPVI